MIVAAAITAFAQKTRRIFADNRKLSLGASEIGTCLRRTFFAKHDEQLGAPNHTAPACADRSFEDHG